MRKRSLKKFTEKKSPKYKKKSLKKKSLKKKQNNQSNIDSRNMLSKRSGIRKKSNSKMSPRMSSKRKFTPKKIVKKQETQEIEEKIPYRPSASKDEFDFDYYYNDDNDEEDEVIPFTLPPKPPATTSSFKVPIPLPTALKPKSIFDAVTGMISGLFTFTPPATKTENDRKEMFDIMFYILHNTKYHEEIYNGTIDKLNEFISNGIRNDLESKKNEMKILYNNVNSIISVINSNAKIETTQIDTVKVLGQDFLNLQDDFRTKYNDFLNELSTTMQKLSDNAIRSYAHLKNEKILDDSDLNKYLDLLRLFQSEKDNVNRKIIKVKEIVDLQIALKEMKEKGEVMELMKKPATLTSKISKATSESSLLKTEANNIRYRHIVQNTELQKVQDSIDILNMDLAIPTKDFSVYERINSGLKTIHEDNLVLKNKMKKFDTDVSSLGRDFTVFISNCEYVIKDFENYLINPEFNTDRNQIILASGQHHRLTRNYLDELQNIFRDVDNLLKDVTTNPRLFLSHLNDSQVANQNFKNIESELKQEYECFKLFYEQSYSGILISINKFEELQRSKHQDRFYTDTDYTDLCDHITDAIQEFTDLKDAFDNQSDSLQNIHLYVANNQSKITSLMINYEAKLNSM